MIEKTGIKYALVALGIGSGEPVSPLEPADAERKARIDAMIKKRPFGRKLT